MSEIPYIFKAFPDEFLTNEFIEDVPMMKFIRYILQKIRHQTHIEKIHNNRRFINLELKPGEFVYGREKAAKECGCSDKVIRTRIEQLRASSYLEEILIVEVSKGNFSTVRASSSASKRASSSEPKRASTFTVYRLMTESFRQNKGQQFLDKKGQQIGQQFGVEKGHKEEGEKTKDNKTPTPIPPAPKNPPGVGVREGVGDHAQKAIKFAKLCADRKFPFSEKVIFKLYDQYPKACYDVLLAFDKRSTEDKILKRPDYWLKKEVLEQHEYLEQQKEYK